MVHAHHSHNAHCSSKLPYCCHTTSCWLLLAHCHCFGGPRHAKQQVHIKTSVGLTTQPKVTVSAASGYKNLVFGGEVAYSTEKSAVSNYGLALGLHAGDSQLAVHLQVS